MIRRLSFGIFFFLFILPGVFAIPNSSYYLYDDKSLKLSKASFHRYVMPQLKAMSREYDHLLKKLHPINQELVALKGHLVHMDSTFQNFESFCKKNREECAVSVGQLYGKARKLDGLLLSLSGKKIDFSPLRQEREISSMVVLMSSLHEMTLDNYKFMHALEQDLITVKTHYFSPSQERFRLKSLFYKMSLTSGMIQTFLLREKLKQDFDFAWHHFFKLIEKHAIREKRVSFILKHLEGLNMAWNTFHMKITKGNHSLPGHVTSIAKIMHNRWNSILKVILN